MGLAGVVMVVRVRGCVGGREGWREGWGGGNDVGIGCWGRSVRWDGVRGKQGPEFRWDWYVGGLLCLAVTAAFQWVGVWWRGWGWGFQHSCYSTVSSN